jgi:hypothetical protein
MAPVDLRFPPTICCIAVCGVACGVMLGRPSSTYLATSTPPLASVASLASTAAYAASRRESVRTAGLRDDLWLGSRDSNPDTAVQSRMSCRWTTPQRKQTKLDAAFRSVNPARHQELREQPREHIHRRDAKDAEKGVAGARLPPQDTSTAPHHGKTARVTGGGALRLHSGQAQWLEGLPPGQLSPRRSRSPTRAPIRSLDARIGGSSRSGCHEPPAREVFRSFCELCAFCGEKTEVERQARASAAPSQAQPLRAKARQSRRWRGLLPPWPLGLRRTSRPQHSGL